MAEPPVIPEILPPGTPLPPGLADNRDPQSRGVPNSEAGPVPFHPAASTLLIIIDNLWAMEDWLILTWFLTIPLSFLTVFLPTLILQRRLRNDSWSTAFAKALFFGVVAAVPTSITGTPVGLALLAWAGVRRPGKQ